MLFARQPDAQGSPIHTSQPLPPLVTLPHHAVCLLSKHSRPQQRRYVGARRAGHVGSRDDGREDMVGQDLRQGKCAVWTCLGPALTAGAGAALPAPTAGAGTALPAPTAGAGTALPAPTAGAPK
eukprot:350324-Chlamydomonas_euryale.AAC.7